MVKQDENGNWPEPQDWPHITAWVTCHTKGCRVEGVAFETTIFENPPCYEKYQVTCGQCHTRNYDIVEITDEVDKTRHLARPDQPRVHITWEQIG